MFKNISLLNINDNYTRNIYLQTIFLFLQNSTIKARIPKSPISKSPIQDDSFKGNK